MSNDTSRISITAHYTGYTWYKNNMSDRRFATGFGALSFHALRPANFVARKVAGLDLQSMLLQRHYLMDKILSEAINDKEVGQVLELACGLSPRGYTFVNNFAHRDLQYFEGDLPGMKQRKEKLLQELHAPEKLKVVTCNILETSGEDSLEYIFGHVLDPDKPVAVITEGLVNYFPLDVIESFWSRLAVLLKEKGGFYLTDIVTENQDHSSAVLMDISRRVIGAVARGNVPLHYHDDEDLQQGFEDCGFGSVDVLNPDLYREELELEEYDGESVVRVVKAC